MTESFVLDLTSYKDRIGARVPKGRYRVVIDDAEMDRSKAGNPMINLWFRILDGDYADQTITDRVTITDKAMFRVVNLLQALGIKTPKKRIQLNLAQIIGKVLEIDVEDGEPYNGRVKTEVRGYLRVAKKGGSAGSDVPDLDDIAPEEDPEEDTYTEDEESDDAGDDGDDDGADEEAVEETATEEAPEEESDVEEEPEPEPVKAAPKAKAKPAAKKAPEPEPEEAEDDTLDLDDLEL